MARAMVRCICEELSCEKPFEARKSDRDRGRARFCSRSCSSKAPNRKQSEKFENERPEYTCGLPSCGKKFKRAKSKETNSKSGIRFCSRACKDLAQRKFSGVDGINPEWYQTSEEGTIHTYRGLALAVLEHVCADCGWKEYPKTLEVHHIDNNRYNNHISNLVILCPNCHKVRHFVPGFKYGPPKEIKVQDTNVDNEHVDIQQTLKGYHSVHTILNLLS